MRRLTERVFERLLFESTRGDSYGTCVYMKMLGPRMRVAIAYDADKLADVLSKKSGDPTSHLKTTLVDCILGTIMIRATPDQTGPCAGAWEVTGSAGPKYGKLVYAMGYYMSPTGRLIPDRFSLSQDAVLAWSKVGKSSSIPLDDKTHPRPGREPFHDLHHTEDPSDDCLIYTTGVPGDVAFRNVRGVNRLDPRYVDAVNRAYAMGTMGYDIEGMRHAHENFVSEYLASKLGIPTDGSLNDIFDSAGVLFFDKHYE